MLSILSTKKLKPNQRDLLLGQGFTLVDYNAIEIEFLDFKMPGEIENAIFTSQNGVKAFLNKGRRSEFVEDREFIRQTQGDNANYNCFCVGQKTKSLLEEKGLKVIETANYGADLAKIIAKNYQKGAFHLFCGELRRDEIPNMLKASNINVSEVKTYKTVLKPRKFEQNWDGILFFSPSGVESFFTLNKVERTHSTLLVCIGETTADAARKYGYNVVVANTTLVESVIAKTVNVLKDK